MKKNKHFNRKLALLVLETIFENRQRRVVKVNSYVLAERVSKKKLITVTELDEILVKMHQLGLIDFVAKNADKGYTYKVTLENKGEFYLKENLNKLSDFFVGLFVYLLFIGLIILLVFALKNIFSY
jgi:hypothetical protein